MIVRQSLSPNTHCVLLEQHRNLSQASTSQSDAVVRRDASNPDFGTKFWRRGRIRSPKAFPLAKQRDLGHWGELILS